MALDSTSDNEVLNLIRVYEKAERDILKQINKGLLRPDEAKVLKSMQANVSDILRNLKTSSREWCDSAVPNVYRNATDNVDQILDRTQSFGKVHKSAAKILADNAYKKFEDINAVIGRNVDDIYRQISLENLHGTILGYDTTKNAAQQIKKSLADRGVTGFKDSSGREWDMSRYSEMVARTTTAETHLEATRNRLMEYGIDLIRVTEASGACPLCAYWENKTLSLTGKTEGYPTLAEAKRAGLFHPNCRHAYSAEFILESEPEAKGVKTDKKSSTVKGIMSVNTHKALNKEIRKSGSFDSMASIDADIGRLDLNAVKESVAAMETVTEKWPQLKGIVKSINVSDLDDNTMSCNMVSRGNKLGVEISFSSDYTEYETIREIAVNVDETGVWINKFNVKATNIDPMATHEMGHALEVFLINKRTRSFDKAMQMWTEGTIPDEIVKEALDRLEKDGVKKSAAILRTEISEYATVSTSETMAEAIADVLANKEEAAQLSKKIVEVIDEVMGK